MGIIDKLSFFLFLGQPNVHISYIKSTLIEKTKFRSMLNDNVEMVSIKMLVGVFLISGLLPVIGKKHFFFFFQG